MANDNYPWIKRSPGIGLNEILSRIEPGKNSRAIKKLIKRRLRSVLRHASNPIQVEETPEGRCIIFMGVTRITIDAHHRFLVTKKQYLMDREQHYNDPQDMAEYRYFLQWDYLTPDFDDLYLCPVSGVIRVSPLNPWIYAAQMAYADLAGTEIPWDGDDPYSEAWRKNDFPAFQWLREWIDEYPLQRQLTEALGIDSAIASLAYPTWGDALKNIQEYVPMIRNRAWFCQLGKDEPRLLELGQVLRYYQEAIDDSLEPVAGIKHLLRSFGLTPGGWRFLLQAPELRYTLDAVYYNWRSPERLVLWLNAHAKAGLHALVNIDVAFGCENVLPGFGVDEEPIPDALAPVLAIVVRQAAAAEAEGRFTEWWHKCPLWAIGNWMCRHPDFIPDKNQYRSGFRWLLRHVKRERDAWRRMLYTDRVWPYALKEFQQGGLVAHALESMQAIQEEGVAMENFLDGRHSNDAWDWRLEAIDQGISRYFSIRNDSGTRLATLQIHLKVADNEWVPQKCLGPANSETSDDVLEFAEVVVAAYAEAASHPDDCMSPVAVFRAQPPRSHLL